MAGVVHLLVDNYQDVMTTRTISVPSTDEWPLMQSPVPILSILAFYLYFVLKLGPKLMEKREAFDLKYVLIFYNLYQVVFSTWLCAKIFKNTEYAFAMIGKGCNTKSDIPPAIMREFYTGVWWYFFSKIVELLDTVFFVLRKKQNQVSFLHVYHHSIMAFFTWIYIKYLPGEQGVFIGFLNSFVHIIMYTYYFIAALGPQFQKYLWWKKYMTWLQLTQFAMMLTYLIYIHLQDCKINKIVTYFFFVNISIFMYLFIDFYRKAYSKKSARAKKPESVVMNGKTTKAL